MSNYPEAWPPDFEEYVFLARAISRLCRDDVWRGLYNGELEAVGSSKERADFAPVPLSRMRFFNQAEQKDRVLDYCVIDLIDQRSIRHRIVRRRVPVPHWIYVTWTSFSRFEKALKPKAARPAGKLKDEDITRFVNDYLDTEPKPTLAGIRNKWSTAGHGAQASPFHRCERASSSLRCTIEPGAPPKFSLARGGICARKFDVKIPRSKLYGAKGRANF